MSLLSYNELCELVEQGVIRELGDISQVNSSSIDVRLGGDLIIEVASENSSGVVDPKKRTNFGSKRINLYEVDHYDMDPGEFVLAHTVEKFYLPLNLSAEFKLKSSGARSGLSNALATWCDPGWQGSTLTLELKNYLRSHRIRLTRDMFIGQMIFHRHDVSVPLDKSYTVRGRYNNDNTVNAVKE